MYTKKILPTDHHQKKRSIFVSVSHASSCPIKLVSHGTTPTHTHTENSILVGSACEKKHPHHPEQQYPNISLARFLQIYYAAVSQNWMKWKVKPRSWNNATHTFTIFMCPRCWLDLAATYGQYAHTQRMQ